MKKIIVLWGAIALLPAVSQGQTCKSTAQEFRTITGYCNNPIEPNLGVAWDIDIENSEGPVREGIFRRFEQAEYSDIATRTSPRDEVANPIVASADLMQINVEDGRYWSHTNLFFVYMMQFVTHDMALTVSPPADPLALNAGLGIEKDAEGTDFLLGGATVDYLDEQGVPQQYNGASAFLDLSSTYGPTKEISNALRTFEGGLLKTAQRKDFRFTRRNTPSRDLCDCVNTDTGEPWSMFNEDLSNIKEVFVESAPGFIPEPFVHLDMCVSPAASFGSTFIPGVGEVPATPGVYSCPNSALGTPPMLLENVKCSINYAALNDPTRSDFEWSIPDGVDWMPFVSETSPQVPFDELTASTNDPSKAFAAGDLRATENLGITVIQNLWLREHNRNARLLSKNNPDWSDEQIFQVARARTIGVYQKVVYNEFLPIIVGKKLTQKYKLTTKYKDSDYDGAIDPRTGNSFAAAAMRFGHSMVTNDVFPLDPVTMERIPTNQKQLPANYFGQNSPAESSINWIHLGAAAQSTAFAPVDEMMAFIGAQVPSASPPDDAIMAGLVNSRAQMVDRYVEISLNKLDVSNCFSGAISVSVPGFSVFRGRTHGLPSYHQLAKQWTGNSIYGTKGCPEPQENQEYDPLQCFEALTQDTDSNYALQLRDTFKRLDLMDPFVGMLIESEIVCTDCQFGSLEGSNELNHKAKVKNGIVGPTAGEIIADQFYRSKYGDRFWFENSIHGWSQSDLRAIHNTTMKDLISTHFPSLSAQLKDRDSVLIGAAIYN
ncbi:peroxidase family protein [Vibrio breoganii]